MKKCIFILLAIFVNNVASAQQTQPSDDVINSLRLPVFSQTADEIENAIALSTNEKLCFDRRIVFHSISQQVSETVLFINSEKGYMGLITGKPGKVPHTLETESEDFNLLVFDRYGSTYNYTNRMKNGELVHWVATLNSDIDPNRSLNINSSEYTFNSGRFRLKSNTSYSCCGGYLTGLPYSTGSSNAPVLYLLGGVYPMPNEIELYDFIGYAGIGYYIGEAGPMLGIKAINTRGGFEVKSYATIDICFEGSMFTKMEQKIFETESVKLEDKNKKLEEKTYSGNCSTLQKARDIEKIAENNRQKELMGNIRVTNATSREGMSLMAEMQNPVHAMRIDLLDLDVEICKLNGRLDAAITDSDRQSLIKLIGCKRDSKITTQKNIEKMEALNRTFADNPGKLTMERHKLMAEMRRVPKNSDCK